MVIYITISTRLWPWHLIYLIFKKTPYTTYLPNCIRLHQSFILQDPLNQDSEIWYICLFLMANSTYHYNRIWRLHYIITQYLNASSDKYTFTWIIWILFSFSWLTMFLPTHHLVCFLWLTNMFLTTHHVLFLMTP